MEPSLPSAAMMDLRIILSKKGAFSYLASAVGVQVPANLISQTEGNAPFLDPKFLLGNKDRVPTEIGYNAAVPKSTIELSSRSYRIRRLGWGVPFNRKIVDNELFHEKIKDHAGPAIGQAIGLQLDGNHLTPIMRGEGSADESRDVTTREVPGGAKWDTDDSEFFDEIEEAVLQVQSGVTGLHATEEEAHQDQSGKVIGVFSKDVIAKVKKTKTFREAFSGGLLERRVPHSAVAELIMSETGLDKVIIGNKAYQDGSEFEEYSAARVQSNVAFVTAEGNLGIIPYAKEDELEGDGGVSLKEVISEDPPVTTIVGDLWCDLITYFPALSWAFTDLFT